MLQCSLKFRDRRKNSASALHTDVNDKNKISVLDI